MTDTVISFDELSRTLEPVFGGKNIRLVVEESQAFISTEYDETDDTNVTFKNSFANAEERRAAIRALRGVLHEYANPELRELEKEAYAEYCVEKYEKILNS
jgi:hypothetical protein